ARRYALRRQVMRELGRLPRELRERKLLVAAVGVGEDHRDAVRGGMAIDALARDVEALAIAVEELPQLLRRIVFQRVRVGDVFRQQGHRSVTREKVLPTMRPTTTVVK